MWQLANMNRAFLNSEEINFLMKKFDFRTNLYLDRSRSLNPIDLLDEGNCSMFLDWLTSTIDSPSRFVSGSQFSKRFAYLVIAPSLYSMTMFNKGLDLSLENFSIENASLDRSWLSHISLNEIIVSQPTIGKRQEWRDAVIQEIFR